ncbi:hypothetical protein IFO70_19065 [Phormidium tenue FACHB-886]|nr:hypothetical protein [Phormidium tenue FACHB-886]
MKTWLKNLLVLALATMPINSLIAVASFGDLASIDHEAPQKAKPLLTASSKFANDFVFDLKVQTGIVPPPIF